MKINCSDITDNICDFYASLNDLDTLIISLLEHYNEIHDKYFVPRCRDDLFIEYTNIILKIRFIIARGLNDKPN